ncbi:MAG TPA: CrcB family protein [Mycobacteriales bacterium]|nr:CrcB family protein [Mycobacteriales bacterium]
MTHSHARPDAWPVDTDVTPDDTRVDAHHPSFTLSRLGLVLSGGFCGGLLRDEVVSHWATKSGAFPWPIFVVNTAGAFVLGAVVIVALDVLAKSRYLRPLLGTGFCGALTTFSSVAVGVDQLLRHGRIVTGVGYLLASLAAGLAAAALGAAFGRTLPATRARRRAEANL